MLRGFLDELIQILRSEGSHRLSEHIPQGSVLLGIGIQSPFVRASRNSARSTTNLRNLKIEAAYSSMAVHDRVWFLSGTSGDRILGQWPDLGQKSLKEIRIGRTSDNHIVLPETSVSRNQAAFWLYRGAVSLIDRGSKNGSYVDDGRLGRDEVYPLVGKEYINLGRFRFQYLTRPQFLLLIEDRLNALIQGGSDGIQVA